MLVVNFLNRFTLAFWRFNLSKFLWYLAGRNIAVCEQMLECSGALQGEAQCFWFLCTLKIGVLFFVSMPGSWLWEAPGLSFTSIVSWLENLSTTLDSSICLFGKTNRKKKNKRNLKSFQVDCDNCDHVFFWPWSVPSQGRSWGESLEWLTSKKGLGYGLEGLTTFCFFFWFCLILFVQAANTLGRADLEFRSTRTSALSLIEKAMVAGDPKAHECHQYHFKAFPK